jgi:hypothetical protein
MKITLLDAWDTNIMVLLADTGDISSNMFEGSMVQKSEWQ